MSRTRYWVGGGGEDRSLHRKTGGKAIAVLQAKMVAAG